MTDHLDGLDAPRPLSPALRARLEDALLAPSARPLTAGAAAELADALAIQELLADLEVPRPVPAAVRARFTPTRSPVRRWAPALVAAAAAVAAGVAVLLPSGAPPRTTTTQATAATEPPGALLFRRDSLVPGSLADATGFAAHRSGTSQALTTVTKSARGIAPGHLITLTPASGDVDGGTWVTLTGYGFRRTPVVTFGGVPAARVEVRSATVVRALSPRHLSGPVFVAVDGSNGLTFLYL